MPSVKLRAEKEQTSSPEDVLQDVLHARGLLEKAKSFARYYGIPLKEIVGPSRFHSVIAVRNEVCVLLRESGLTYIAIGRLLSKDHTTIINAVVRGTEARAK
jgi:chromosomal replication initiation ATPase DnaA